MREPFPFWTVVFAVALGALIANAITWAAAEARMAYEVRQLIKRDPFGIPETAKVTPPPRRDAARSAPPDMRPAYVRPARVGVPTGETACLAGQVVKREENGWSAFQQGDGKPVPCRDYR